MNPDGVGILWYDEIELRDGWLLYEVFEYEGCIG